MKRTVIWTLALLAGALIGVLGIAWLNEVANVVATVYTRLFQLLAVPTVVLAVVNTFATFSPKGSGKLFRRTLTYTLLTTFAAAAVAALLYVLIAPTPPSESLADASLSAIAEGQHSDSYLEHLISVVPDNLVRPFLEGNVLSLLVLAFAVGIALSKLPGSDGKTVLVSGLQALQDLLFMLIRWLVSTLPVGIVAFAAQLSAQLSAGVAAGSIGRYVLVVLLAGVVQFFVVLPLLLLLKGLNPLRVLSSMMPAVLMALFTKSSAATLPVTMETAEQRLGVSPGIARFVLPICTTINMNGCAAFILVTSLFVMQQGAMTVDALTILLWVFISVFAAVGNAGVPMGCYFLTLSLMAGIGAPVAVMAIILPIYSIIDMVETAENVWSDSCVTALIDHDFRK